jgi:hypothetical protein
MKLIRILNIWIFSGLMIVNLLFVPWIDISRHSFNRGEVRDVGYSWIFKAPNSIVYGMGHEYWSRQIDWSRVAAQSVAIVILFGAIFITLHMISRKESSE